MLITACPEAQSKYVRLTQLQKTEFTSAPTVQQVSEAVRTLVAADKVTDVTGQGQQRLSYAAAALK